MTAITPNSGRPIGVVIEITLTAAKDDAALDVTIPDELARVLETAVDETAVDVTVVAADVVVDIY